eukprot:g706.t1
MLTNLYDGERLAAVGRVIVVAANYRLNAFGYLGSSALRAEDSSTGNWGTQDQRAAMKWIHDNAQSLGADVSRLMIFGESAGAGSVTNHLVHPRSFPYYSRAAMESGPFADWSAQTMAGAEVRILALAANAGCPSHTSSMAARCLRGKSAAEIIEAQDKGVTSGDAFCTWGPVIDGVELTASPVELARSGKFNKGVPVLLGTNRDEGSAFVGNLSMQADRKALDAYISEKLLLPNATLKRVQEAYPCSVCNATKLASACWWTFARAGGDLFATCPARRSARWLSAHNDVYLYFFKHKLKLTSAIEAATWMPLGVFHGSELCLVFDGPDCRLSDDAGERRLAEQIVQLWTSFADTGVPRLPPGLGGASIKWPRYSVASDQNLDIDIPLGVTTGLKQQHCDLWDKIDSPPHGPVRVAPHLSKGKCGLGIISLPEAEAARRTGL